jgi:hypothetical protein
MKKVKKILARAFWRQILAPDWVENESGGLKMAEI